MNIRAFRRVTHPCALFLVLGAGSLVTSRAAAQDSNEESTALHEIVVYANRLRAKVKDIASAVSVISAEDIAQSGAVTVPDLLRRQPGLDVVQSGPAGGNVAVFIRGANSEHTLVMVDGVLLNNPVTTSRLFNLANMPLDLIERIEIIRGPQSSLYGSDALGGVISIVTKRGKGAPTASFEAEGGSFGTAKTAASIAGGEEGFDYSFSASRFHTDGISAASKRDGNREKDGNDILGIAGQFGYTPSEQFSLRSTIRVNQSETEIDNFGGVGGDDPNRTVDNQTIAAGVVAEGAVADGIVRPSVGYTIADHALDDKNDPDSAHPQDSLRSSYDGTLMKGFGTLQIDPSDAISTLVGVESIREVAQSTYRSLSSFGPYDEDVPEKSAQTNGGFVQLRARPLSGFTTEGSVRIDDNQRFDQRTTWRFAPQYVIEDTGTRFRATVGTGYKAPSLYQIFSQYGDRGLRPERSTGWDAGIEQAFCERAIVFEALYFQNRLSNLINFDPGTFRFQNISEATTNGVELSSRWSVVDGFDLSASYTYTDPTDTSTNQRLLRRARNKADFNASYRIGKRYTVTGGYTLIGRRADLDFSGGAPERVFLGSYGLVNVGLQVQLARDWQLNVHMSNLLNKEYEEVQGYGTFGMGAYAGVRYQFGAGV